MSDKVEWKTYRPSNGCEGDWFMEKWCAKCEKRDPEYLGCDLIARSYVHNSDHPDYPKELQYAFFPEGMDARCTAFLPSPPSSPDKEVKG